MASKNNPDKPQGFEVGKQQRRGIYSCYFNCGAQFTTRDEAANHYQCPGYRLIYVELIKMNEVQGEIALPEYYARAELPYPGIPRVSPVLQQDNTPMSRASYTQIWVEYNQSQGNFSHI